MIISSPRPLRGFALVADAHRNVGENIHLDDKECRQIGASSRKAGGIEGRRVILAAVTSVEVLAQAVLVEIAVGKPPFGPRHEFRVDRIEPAGRDRSCSDQMTERPAVNGGLAEAPHATVIVDQVREHAVSVLVVKQKNELIPGQSAVSGSETEGVEAVVPRPDRVHPILRHEDARAPEESSWSNRARPQQAPCCFTGRYQLGWEHRESRGPRGEFLMHRYPALLEGWPGCRRDVASFVLGERDLGDPIATRPHVDNLAVDGVRVAGAHVGCINREKARQSRYDVVGVLAHLQSPRVGARRKRQGGVHRIDHALHESQPCSRAPKTHRVCVLPGDLDGASANTQDQKVVRRRGHLRLDESIAVDAEKEEHSVPAPEP